MIIFWFLKKKTIWVVKKCIVFVFKRNDHSMKTLCNFCRGKQQPLRKPSLSLNINDLVSKTLFYIIYIEEKWPCHKMFYILRLNMLDIHLFIFAPIVLFFQLFDSDTIAYGILKVFVYWYICIFNRRENDLFIQKSFTWPRHVLYLFIV